MQKYLLSLCLCLTLGPWLSAAASASEQDGAEALIEALAGLEHLQGNFEQRQFDTEDTLIAESKGRFKLLRPGYFSWEITAPDSQIVIATPEYLWHYDRDLETVTRRPVASGGGTTPLQILGGNAQALRRDFLISPIEPGVFFLESLDSEVGFETMTLTLDKGRPSRMDIRDNLKQRVVVDFLELDGSTPLTPEDFAFEPPPGVDLFHYDE